MRGQYLKIGIWLPPHLNFSAYSQPKAAEDIHPLTSYILFVRLSTYKQFENRWKDRNWIWYWSVLLQFVDVLQFSLKSTPPLKKWTWRTTCVLTGTFERTAVKIPWSEKVSSTYLSPLVLCRKCSGFAHHFPVMPLSGIIARQYQNPAKRAIPNLIIFFLFKAIKGEKLSWSKPYVINIPQIQQGQNIFFTSLPTFWQVGEEGREPS